MSVCFWWLDPDTYIYLDTYTGYTNLEEVPVIPWFDNKCAPLESLLKRELLKKFDSSSPFNVSKTMITDQVT